MTAFMIKKLSHKNYCCPVCFTEIQILDGSPVFFELDNGKSGCGECGCELDMSEEDRRDEE